MRREAARSAGRLGTGLAVAGALIAARLGTCIWTAWLGGVGALAEKLHVVHLDFGGEALVAGLVRPLAGAEFALDINLGAFADEAFGYVGIVAPGDDVMPFSVFAELAVAVAIAFGGGQAEGSHLGIALRALGIGIKVTDFGVVSNVTDEHDFVE